jgi:serine/threonine protein kinase
MPGNALGEQVAVGRDLDAVFMAMEFMEHDLKGLLDEMKRPFSQAEAKTLMLQLLEGTAYLHDHWVLHRCGRHRSETTPKTRSADLAITAAPSPTRAAASLPANSALPPNGVGVLHAPHPPATRPLGVSPLVAACSPHAFTSSLAGT